MTESEVCLYIPCYNAQETIRSCLDAVLKQTFPVKEILIIDDGSNDRTVEFASPFPVKIVRQNHKGLAAARNMAIRNTDKEFIASVDADCLPEPGWLGHLMARFNSKKVAGAGGKLLEAYSTTVFDLWRSVHMKQYWDGNTKPSFLFGSNTVFRKKALEEAGLYNEDFKNNYEDVDICMRLKKKRYDFIYEPKAAVDHIKSDDLYSVLTTYWKWHFAYYRTKNYYSNQKAINFKIKDNFGLAYRYIEEDMASKRYQLVYLDFLLALHHSLSDLEYFVTKDSQSGPVSSGAQFPWLALLDLAFFYRYDATKNNLSTLIAEDDASLQNLLALSFILGKCIKEHFVYIEFNRMLYKHLFYSLYRINNEYLLEWLINMVESNQDWDGLLKKKQPNLESAILKIFTLNFKKFMNDIIRISPEIVRILHVSAEKTDKLLNFAEEVLS